MDVASNVTDVKTKHTSSIDLEYNMELDGL